MSAKKVSYKMTHGKSHGLFPRRPVSIRSDGDCRLPRQESIGLAACQLAIVLEKTQQDRAEEEVENVGKRTPSDAIETGRRGKSPSDSPRVILQET